MWTVFFLGVIVSVLFSFVPGYVFLRGLSCNRYLSLGLAPCLSMGSYVLIGTVASLFGVFCDWTIVFFPSLSVAVLVYVIGKLLSLRGKRGDMPTIPGCKSDLSIYALFILVAAAITGFVFIESLDGANSFGLSFDNAYHLGRIRGMIDWGNWSTIGSSIRLYYGVTDFVSPEGVLDQSSLSGFYPSSFHVSVAMIVSALGATPAVATNAFLSVLLIFIFPSGMFFLGKELFPGDRTALVSVGVTMMCFAAFQWWMIANALMAYLSGMCLFPAVAGLFVYSVRSGLTVGAHLRRLLLFFVCLACAAVAHPCVVFSLVVFLFPLCVKKVVCLSRLTESIHSMRNRLLAGLGCVAVFCFVWACLYNSSFMQGVIYAADRPAYLSFAQAFVNIADLNFRWGTAQPVLAIVVLMGIIKCFLDKRNRWLVVSYASMAFLFFISVTQNGFLDYLFSGFWYTDHQRVAAYAALFAIPLAALGLSSIIQGAKRLAPLFFENRGGALASCMACLVFLIAVYFPSFYIGGHGSFETAFSSVRHQLSEMYSEASTDWYSSEEREFVEKVSAITNSEPIFNMPSDGSAFAYGQDGLNVFFRRHDLGFTSDSEFLRLNLANLATDEEVQRAVRDTGIKYVMLLDYRNQTKGNVHFTYDPDKWVGVDSISDDTPGFEVVLAEDDMRLYKITGLD